jgi:plastocyanin
MNQHEPTENNATMFGSKISNKNRGLRLMIALVVLAVTIVVVVVAVVLVTKGFGSDTKLQSVEEIDSEVATVQITSDGLTPAAIRVKAGQQVEFTNQDSRQHRIMADPDSLEGFDSESYLSTGDSYTYVFDTPGTYYYYDSVAPESLTGSVEVRK